MAPHSSASHRPVAVRQTMPYGMVTLLDSGEAVPHRLTREETMVCIEGRAFASLSGEIFEMTPGSAIVIPPDTEFSIRNPHATPRHATPRHAIPGRCRAPSRRTGDHRRPAAVHPTVGKLRKSLAGSLWLVNVYGRVRAVGHEQPLAIDCFGDADLRDGRSQGAANAN